LRADELGSFTEQIPLSVSPKKLANCAKKIKNCAKSTTEFAHKIQENCTHLALFMV